MSPADTMPKFTGIRADLGTGLDKILLVTYDSCVHALTRTRALTFCTRAFLVTHTHTHLKALTCACASRGHRKNTMRLSACSHSHKHTYQDFSLDNEHFPRSKKHSSKIKQESSWSRKIREKRPRQWVPTPIKQAFIMTSTKMLFPGVVRSTVCFLSTKSAICVCAPMTVSDADDVPWDPLRTPGQLNQPSVRINDSEVSECAVNSPAPVLQDQICYRRSNSAANK